MRLFRRRRRATTPVEGIDVRYVLYVGPLGNGEKWARDNHFAPGRIIPIARASQLLWGLRGPIAVCQEDGYLEKLPPREKRQALEAIERVQAINLVTWSQQGGEDVG